MNIKPSQPVSPPPLRIGEILIRNGHLNAGQVRAILDRQSETDMPFGLLAERLFSVPREAVAEAWVEQYLLLDTQIDLRAEHIDPEVLTLVDRRQAWQFRILPMRREDSALVLTTTRANLKKAVQFAWQQLEEPLYFLIADSDQLTASLQEHYPWPAAEWLAQNGGHAA